MGCFYIIVLSPSSFDIVDCICCSLLSFFIISIVLLKSPCCSVFFSSCLFCSIIVCIFFSFSSCTILGTIIHSMSFSFFISPPFLK